VRVRQMGKALDLACLTPDVDLDALPELSGGHVSDLLSDVLANAPSGGVLVTIQVHMNVIAVASHCGLAAVVFAAGRQPDDALARNAAEEGIALFVSSRSAFDVVGALYELGLRGSPG
jgi:hypothetical protein